MSFDKKHSYKTIFSKNDHFLTHKGLALNIIEY